MKRLLITTTALVLTIYAGYARPLTRAEQEQLTKGFYPTCINGPHIRDRILERGGGAKEQSKYCSCAGHYLARTMDFPQAATEQQHAAAFSYCMKQVFSHLPKWALKILGAHAAHFIGEVR
jgi:hypothetical protein